MKAKTYKINKNTSGAKFEFALVQSVVFLH